MNKKDLILSEAEIELTLEEICHTIHVDENTIYELIEFEIITPKGSSPQEYTFDATSLARAKKAMRFHRDLEVNFPGVSLAFELLERIEKLERELN